MQQPMRVECHDPVRTRPVYWPIANYGIIGDCRTAALVAPDGAIDWCCLPHFDSPAVFCRLVDAERGGYFRVGPAGGCDATMAYLPSTNILDTVFTTSGAHIRLTDYMPIRARAHGAGALRQLMGAIAGGPHGLRAGLEREVGNDVAAAHRINRMVSCLSGEEQIEVVLRATMDYARQTPQLDVLPLAGGNAGAVLRGDGHYLVLVVAYQTSATADRAPIQLSAQGDTLRSAVALRAGQTLVVALNYARSEQEAYDLLHHLARHDYARDLDETLAYWREWAAQCQYTGPYQQAVLRSALALKLCIFEPTGAIVAAPTTSLPESIGGIRNWDYRYTWLRDSAFTLNALGRLGYYDEARDYFHFLHDLHVRRIEDLRVMYGIRGEQGAQLAEHSIESLSGYRDSHPVRVGNGAAMQHQLDVYGELLDAAYTYIQHAGFRRGPRLLEPNRDIPTLAARIADYVAAHWHERDHGIWEIRGEPRAFVYSRVMCWVALDRACQLLEGRVRRDVLAGWRAACDALRASILEQGYSEQLQVFTQAYSAHNLDAANLRIPLVHFLPPDDPRVRGTIEETKRKLAGPHGILFRYEPSNIAPGQNRALGEDSVDGLPGKEGAFLACTFWLISNLCQIGQVDEARQRFEDLIACASPLGLFSEELDPHTLELLGNFPQAFTHIGLINTAARLQAAQEGTQTAHAGQETRG